MRSFAHWCALGHEEIGYKHFGHELCPLCRMINERDNLADERDDLLIRLDGYRAAEEVRGSGGRTHTAHTKKGDR